MLHSIPSIFISNSINIRYLTIQTKKLGHIALLGAPVRLNLFEFELINWKKGCGKGTQAKYIKQDFGLHIISTGDLLRQEIFQKSSIGQKVNEIVGKGGSFTFIFQFHLKIFKYRIGWRWYYATNCWKSFRFKWISFKCLFSFDFDWNDWNNKNLGMDIRWISKNNRSSRDVNRFITKTSTSTWCCFSY